MAEKETMYSLGDWRRIPICTFFKDARLVFKADSLGREILSIALPAAMALTADPIASLVDTAFIGQIGPVELAAVGVSIALFNQVSRIAIFPLVSVTTSFVAEEDTLSGVSPQIEEGKCLEAGGPVDTETKELLPQRVAGTNVHNSDSVGESFNIVKEEHKRRHIPSASSALFIGGILGLIQAIFLISAAKPLLNFMGVNSDSAMLHPAQQYLRLRSLGAPAVLLSLAMQGVFRGFKDTKTPLYATVAGDATNIALDPLFMFVFRLGVSGAAIAHVISQYLISAILLWRLLEQVDLIPPSIKHLQLDRFLKNGFLLLATVIQTMQIPLSYAEDIIGIHGTNIDYIRRTSGAVLTVQESRVPDEIIVEIKGTSSEVQTAQQLIQDFISTHKEPLTINYGRLDAGSRSSYSQLGTASRLPSSLSSQPYTGYGSSGLGDYSTFRL